MEEIDLFATNGSSPPPSKCRLHVLLISTDVSLLPFPAAVLFDLRPVARPHERKRAAHNLNRRTTR